MKKTILFLFILILFYCGKVDDKQRFINSRWDKQGGYVLRVNADINRAMDGMIESFPRSDSIAVDDEKLFIYSNGELISFFTNNHIVGRIAIGSDKVFHLMSGDYNGNIYLLFKEINDTRVNRDEDNVEDYSITIRRDNDAIESGRVRFVLYKIDNKLEKVLFSTNITGISIAGLQFDASGSYYISSLKNMKKGSYDYYVSCYNNSWQNLFNVNISDIIPRQKITMIRSVMPTYHGEYMIVVVEVYEYLRGFVKRVIYSLNPLHPSDSINKIISINEPSKDILGIDRFNHIYTYKYKIEYGKEFLDITAINMEGQSVKEWNVDISSYDYRLQGDIPFMQGDRLVRLYINEIDNISKIRWWK